MGSANSATQKNQYYRQRSQIPHERSALEQINTKNIEKQVWQTDIEAFLKKGKEQLDQAKAKLLMIENRFEELKKNSELIKELRNMDLNEFKIEVNISGCNLEQILRIIQPSRSDDYLPQRTPKPAVYMSQHSSSEEFEILQDKLNCCVSSREVKLLCRHSVCARCFQEEVLKHVTEHNFSISSVKCPVCSIPMSEDELFEVFGSKAGFYGRVEDLLSSGENTRVSTFTCGICTATTNVEGSLTLDCEHRFCNQCMKDFLTSQINANKIRDTDLVCPDASCNCQIREETLRYCFDDQQYAKLTEFRLTNLIPQEHLQKCPSPKCNFRTFISTDAIDFGCPKCKKRYCLQCKQSYYYLGHKCNTSKILQAESYQQEQVREKLRSAGVKECPLCKEGLWKEGGCNFVKCPSESCNHKTFFCWLCDGILTLDGHYTHFQNGPFGDLCKGQILDKRSVSPKVKSATKINSRALRSRSSLASKRQ